MSDLAKPELTPRELAWGITDRHGAFISEFSVYRILRDCNLVTSPAYIVLSASDEFRHKTSRVNQLWQTDFTYFKIIGWVWYYLSTVLDDFMIMNRIRANKGILLILPPNYV